MGKGRDMEAGMVLWVEMGCGDALGKRKLATAIPKKEKDALGN